MWYRPSKAPNAKGDLSHKTAFVARFGPWVPGLSTAISPKSCIAVGKAPRITQMSVESEPPRNPQQKHDVRSRQGRVHGNGKSQ